MFSQGNLYCDIPNAVSYEAVFGKRRNFKFLVAVGTIWSSAEGVLLRGDDAKESSSEPAGGNGTPEVWETESDGTTPPMCKPLPSGKIWTAEDTESVFTGDTRHQADLLLDQEDDFGEPISYKGDSLLVAVEMTDALAVQRLLNVANADVNIADQNEKTALHLASEQGIDEIVQKILVHAEIDVNKKDKNNQTALELACGNNHLQVATRLLAHPKLDILHANSCLCLYACYGQSLIVSCLLKHPDIDVNCFNNATQLSNEVSACTPLYGACNAGSVDILEQLFEHPLIDVNKGNKVGCTPLRQACTFGHLELVEKLLERKEIEMNKADNVGATPLLMACGEGHLEIVEKLLERNEIQVNKAKTDDGSTPLYWACTQGHLEIVEKLLERNEIEVNKATTDVGATALYVACQFGFLEIVEKLLERNEIEVNKARDTGSTPLFVACQNGHLEIVEKLLERNETQVNKAKTDGQTPLTKASQRGHLEIVQKLLQRNEIQVNDAYADQFTPENRNTIQAGSTALIFAAYFGHQAVVQQLLDHPNIQIDQTDDHNNTAMQIAQREGREEIANLLRDHSTKN